MTKHNKPTAGFTATIATNDYAYRQLWIQVLSDYTNTWNRCRAMIKYQSNRETPWDFYGGKLECECESLSDVADVYRFMGRIFKQTGANFVFHNNPVGVLERLRDSLVQVTNDPRHSRFIPVADVQPESFRAWRDDWNRSNYGPDNSGCTFGAVAESEDDARRIITARFCEEKSDYYTKRFQLWLAADRPVIMLERSGWGYPKFNPVDDILKGIADSKNVGQAQAA